MAERLARFFETTGKKYAVVGGYALLAHGIQRATFDIDWVVEESAQDGVIELLEGLGYETLHRSSGYSNHLHRVADFGRLDFVYVDERTASLIFDTAELREILTGVKVPVPRPEHLAAMKAQAIKNDPERKLQDLADVRSLAALPGVDRDEIRDHFDRLGLVELYDAEIADG